MLLSHIDHNYVYDKLIPYIGRVFNKGDQVKGGI